MWFHTLLCVLLVGALVPIEASVGPTAQTRRAAALSDFVAWSTRKGVRLQGVTLQATDADVRFMSYYWRALA